MANNDLIKLICKLENILLEFKDIHTYEETILNTLKDYLQIDAIVWNKTNRKNDKVLVGKKTSNKSIIELDKLSTLEIYNNKIDIDNSLVLYLKEYFSNVLKVEKMHEYLYKDSLTNLSNNNLLEHIKKENEFVENTGVLFVDANGLGVINNNFGHEEGDKLLKTIANCLVHNDKLSFRQNETYRKGGDEFIVICINIPEKIFLNKIKKSMELLKNTLYSASFGYVYSKDRIKLNELIKKADENMYKEKEQYKKNNPDKYKVKKLII